MVEERTRLSDVLAQIDRQVVRLEAYADDKDRDRDTSDVEAQTADEVAAVAVARLRGDRLRDLRVARREPYFGRIDFAEVGEVEPTPLYIGKRGVEAEGTVERLVVDWRAPVARLFYAATGAEQGTSYTSPEGEVTGEIYLKRNIVIRDSNLQRAVDSFVRGEENLSVTDEFLLYRLAEQKDNRLRDIVSTIQAEQDRIIRAPRERAMVIQGVAGSGKTTVALHRLAYLLYEYQDRLRAERMMIFAPNAMFLEYISDVLPELGVGGIRQTTFHSWAIEQMGGRMKLADTAERLAAWFDRPRDEAYEAERRRLQYKASLEFAQKLEHYVADLEQNTVPEVDFEPWEGSALPAKAIAAWWAGDYGHLPPAKRRERVLARVKRWYEMELKRQSSATVRANQRKQASSRFRAYSKKWPAFDVVALYREVAVAEGLIPTVAGRRGAPASAPGRSLVEASDVAGMVYLHTLLFGVDGTERFDHVVIDEAQDFSPLQIEVVKRYCPSQSITILGDLGQSIHTDQGITAWDAFLRLFDEDVRAYFQLDVSYRSTMEIIEFANAVVARFPGFLQAKPVFRSGRPVKVEAVRSEERLSRAVRAVQEMQKEAHTVAVICRRTLDVAAFHEALTAAGVEAYRIEGDESHYQGGVSVLPVYLAKGLEFDAVLLVDTDHTSYDETPFSGRLLYVACTRALHQLRLQYTGRPSPLLPSVAAVRDEKT